MRRHGLAPAHKRVEDMIRFSLLSSGSKGNAILVRTDTCKILIDNGLSHKQLLLRAKDAGETLDDLTAVFVTHEHADHVNGLGVLCRRQGVTAFMTPGTYERLPKCVGPLPKVEVFEAGDSVRVDGLAMRSFSVSHDAADPVGYVIETANAKLGLAADMGHIPQFIRKCLEGAHGLILESNYCPDLLRLGSYPPMIQQRIRGRQGHLSNKAMSELLSSLLHDRLQVVVLTHISEENNTHQLAYDFAADVLRGHTAQVHVALQDRPTCVFEIGA